MPTLVIQLPNLPPVEHVLKDDAITIGRMKGNTIALDNISVSLSHAKLTRKDGDYFLKDLNSTNGTMLNGQSITEARLHDGDHVKFGEVTARFYEVVATPSTPSIPTAVPVTAVPTAPIPPPPTPAPPATPPSGSLSVPPPAPAPPATVVAASPFPKTRPVRPKKSFPLVPVLAGAGGVVVAGFLVWKFFLSGSNPTAESTPPAAPLPVKAAVSDKPRATTPEPVSAPVPAVKKIAAEKPATVQDVPALIQALKSADLAERRRAVAALNSLGTGARDAVPALREALKDADSEVRMWAALSLVNNHVYDQAVVPILVQLLQHENPVLRQVACLSLSLISYSETEKEPVIAALTEAANKDENAEVRNAAVSALKIIVPETAPAGR